MLRRITSKAVIAALALAMMSTAALAGPLGLPQQSKAQSGGITPVAFGWDGGVTLFATRGVVFFLRPGGVAVDANNVVWRQLACCVFGESGGQLVADGILYEPSGVYGFPIVWDGGFDILIRPF